MLYLLNLIGMGVHEEAVAMVVRADDEREARRLADEFERLFHEDPDYPSEWLDPDATTCEPLPMDGDKGVILVDRNSA